MFFRCLVNYPRSIRDGLCENLRARAVPIICSVSRNAGMLPTPGLKGMGAGFCPENLVDARSSGEERKTFMCFKPGHETEYSLISLVPI